MQESMMELERARRSRKDKKPPKQSQTVEGTTKKKKTVDAPVDVEEEPEATLDELLDPELKAKRHRRRQSVQSGSSNDKRGSRRTRITSVVR